MEKKITVSDAELEILEVLWAAQEALSAAEIRSRLSANKSWERTTVLTLIQRLVKKGVVCQEKREVYYYRPLVEQSKLGRYQTQRLIDKLYAGSAKAMVAALVEQGQLQAQDVAELQGMFQDLWEKEDGSS